MNPNCKLLTEQRKRHPNNQIRDYLKYLRRMTKFSMINEMYPHIRISDQTIDGQRELLQVITEYSKKHVLYFNHLLHPNNWPKDRLKALIGCDERGFFRWLRTERARLIKFIEEKEDEILGPAEANNNNKEMISNGKN